MRHIVERATEQVSARLPTELKYSILELIFPGKDIYVFGPDRWYEVTADGTAVDVEMLQRNPWTIPPGSLSSEPQKERLAPIQYLYLLEPQNPLFSEACSLFKQRRFRMLCHHICSLAESEVGRQQLSLVKNLTTCILPPRKATAAFRALRRHAESLRYLTVKVEYWNGTYLQRNKSRTPFGQLKVQDSRCFRELRKIRGLELVQVESQTLSDCQRDELEAWLRQDMYKSKGRMLS